MAFNINTKIRAYNGVVNFINKYDVPPPPKKSYGSMVRTLNDLLIRFLQENKLQFVPNNSPKYKGNYYPVYDNCITVQENFPLFINWMNKNFNKDEIQKS